MYTRCPHCATVFRVTPQQLQASSGQVKCGRCHAQFDAFTSLAATLTGAPAQTPVQPAQTAHAIDGSGTPGSPAAAAFASKAATGPLPSPSAAQAAADPQTATDPRTATDLHAAEDPVAAYVHRYGGPRATEEGRVHLDHQEDDYEEIDGVPATPASSVDQFADSLRVLQTVARLTLEVDETRRGPHADQPWVEAATDAPDISPHGAQDPHAWTDGDERALEEEASAAPGTALWDADPEAADRTEEIALAPPPPAVPEPAQPVLTVPAALLENGAAPVHRRGPWMAGITALALVLALQAVWWFASPAARALPGTRSALEGVCALLGCDVALPQLPEQLFIEASDLQLLDVARPHEVLLTAQVRNRAAVAQQLPWIELTLTGTSNQVVGRRVLRPSDYLDASQRERRGIAGNEEIAIRLYLHTGELRAAGYRLYLFFG
ncbi:MAG: DUF3426 domain-containing protein [Burkholderiales bacterium]|nr:DUF3426 domain-containing protein [Burkholderiales bacterium]